MVLFDILSHPSRNYLVFEELRQERDCFFLLLKSSDLDLIAVVEGLQVELPHIVKDFGGGHQILPADFSPTPDLIEEIVRWRVALGQLNNLGKILTVHLEGLRFIIILILATEEIKVHRQRDVVWTA